MPSISIPKDSLFSCKIALKDVKPRVWRRVLVPTDYSFEELHDVIMAVMEWNDTHLHMFNFKDPESGQRFEIKGKGVEDFGDANDNICFLPESSKIAPFVKKLKQKIQYEYDFGLSWEHVIEFEKIVEASGDVQYPKCIGGKEMAPPEDNPDDKRSEDFDVKRIDEYLKCCRQFAKGLNSKVVNAASENDSGSTTPAEQSAVSGESTKPPKKRLRTGQSSASSSQETE